MATRILPKTLNDGTYNYVQVREEAPDPANPPAVNTALYERVPTDPANVYTPDLAYREGQKEVPGMNALARGDWPMPK